MKILVVGKGGREHALVRALSESPGKPELYCFPGSDAIATLAKPVSVDGLESLIAWMMSNGIDLCVAGEESYLVKGEGLANLCAKEGIACWGPPKESAQLEASKEFAKEFLVRHKIPTARATATATLDEAVAAIADEYPTVLKFDGLAAGKGVAVCTSENEAMDFLDEVFTQQRFGPGRVLVEQCLTGPEVSVFAAIVDDDYLIFTPARDYKRAQDGDHGPNTGGMGAVASRQLVSPELMQTIEREIVRPTVEGLRSEGLPYRGFLYFGLMLTPSGPQVIEYNCRFGDPECQAVMPLVKGDLAAFCHAGAKGELRSDLLSFDEGWSVCVVLAPKLRVRAIAFPGSMFPATAGCIMPEHASMPMASGKLPVDACWLWSAGPKPVKKRSKPRIWPPTESDSMACNAAEISAFSTSAAKTHERANPQRQRNRVRHRSPRSGDP